MADTTSFQPGTPSWSRIRVRTCSSRSLSFGDRTLGASSWLEATSVFGTRAATAQDAAHGELNQKNRRGSGNPAAAYNARTAASARGRSAGAVECRCASHLARTSAADFMVVAVERSVANGAASWTLRGWHLASSSAPVAAAASRRGRPAAGRGMTKARFQRPCDPGVSAGPLRTWSNRRFPRPCEITSFGRQPRFRSDTNMRAIMEFFCRRIAIASMAIIALLPHDIRAQSTATPYELTRIRGSLTIDGVPDEAAWQAIAPLPLTMYTPVFRGSPTQRSEIRVAYDDEFFYAAGWFYDTDPSGIRVNSLYRDRWNGDDAFALYIDAFNDNRNAKWFGLTAGGVRFDQLVSDDGATLNGSWDTFWTARTTITNEGWFAEVRFPFSSIGFHPDAAGKAVMGLTAMRLVSRLQLRVTFPAI